MEIWSRHGPRCSPPGQMPGDSAATAPSGLPLSQPPTFLHHAHSQALLEAAELAAVSPPLIHRAVLVSQADVLGIFLHCALEGGQHGTGCQGVGGGGSPGEGTVQILLPSQTKALSVHSYFSNIWVAGEGEVEGWGKKTSWGHWGGSASGGRPPGPQVRGYGLPGSPGTCTSSVPASTCPFLGADERGPRGDGGGSGDRKLSKHPELGQTQSLFPSPPPALKPQALFPAPFISGQGHECLGPFPPAPRVGEGQAEETPRLATGTDPLAPLQPTPSAHHSRLPPLHCGHTAMSALVPT